MADPKTQSLLEWFRRTCPPGAHFNASRGFYYPDKPTLAAAQARQDGVRREIVSLYRAAGSTLTLAQARERHLQVEREIRWDTIRLGLPPGLAVLASKLDRAMR